MFEILTEVICQKKNTHNIQNFCCKLLQLYTIALRKRVNKLIMQAKSIFPINCLSQEIVWDKEPPFISSKYQNFVDKYK